MNQRKIQVWFRPDQIDLIMAMLGVCHYVLAPYRQSVDGDNAENAARRYCQRRIDEVIALFPVQEGRDEARPDR